MSPPLVVLSYSGGLDTSAIVPWLQETRGARVLCYTADVGQGGVELAGLQARAGRAGAVECVVEDLRERFATEVIFPTLRAGAVYARTYLLGTAMARPVIAAGQVAQARRVGATALAHGCTGKGNDQVRFELAFQTLASDLEVIAPWREWAFRGREDLLAYVAARGVPVDASPERPWSRDRNLWHCSHEGGSLEDPGVAPPEELFLLTNAPETAPATPDEIAITFEQGVPVAVDGVPHGPVSLIQLLNQAAGLHGVGRADVIEDRLVGMKSRGVYETPGGTLLRTAHRELEQLVLDRRTLALKDQLAPRYADLVYEGRWWSAEREALDALVDVTQRPVTGTVRLRLFRGAVTVMSRESPCSLYRAGYATFERDDVFDQRDAGGFIRLFGLPLRLAAKVRAESEPAGTEAVA